MKPMDQSTAKPESLEGMQPWTLPFPEEEWEKCPAIVRLFIASLQKTIEALSKRVEELEARLNRNSSNSIQPPSSDSPHQKPTDPPKKKRKAGGKKGRKGYRQKLLTATDNHNISPGRFRCGWSTFGQFGILLYSPAYRVAPDRPGSHPHRPLQETMSFVRKAQQRLCPPWISNPLWPQALGSPGGTGRHGGQ
jgi:hypothetical protein